MLFSWIVIAKINQDAYIELPSNDYLRVARNPGFLSPLGITTNRAYQPWLVSLQIDAWQEIQRRINKEVGGIATGRSQVLAITEPNDPVPRTVVFTIRFYRPQTIAIEIQVKTEFQIPLEQAFSIRQLDSHPALLAAVDSIVGIIKSGSTRGYSRNNSFFSRPAILVSLPIAQDQFDEWKNANKPLIANLLINNELYESADKLLTEKIFERNKEIDIKYSSVGFSLVSKQGVVTVHAATQGIHKHLADEHWKRFRFLEYALALREFVSEFPAFRQRNEDVADFLLFLSMPFLAEKTNLPKTVTGTLVWQILSNELGLALEVEKLDEHFLQKLEEKSEAFSKIDHNDLHSFEFHKKAISEVRQARRNLFERTYENHKATFWLITTIITTTAGFVAKRYL